jgi:peptidase E
MRVVLFGGAEVELGQVKQECKLIEAVILRVSPSQVLHIPFARTESSEPEWSDGWFERYIRIGPIEYLNANNQEDIKKAKHPLVFISGGHEHRNLMKKICSNPRLLELVRSAEYIIGESAGSMILGEYFWGREGGEQKIQRGLGVIKNTGIVAHYTQRSRQQNLRDLVQETNIQYGIGIDSMTAIEFNLDDFPAPYEKIGSGSIEIVGK